MNTIAEQDTLSLTALLQEMALFMWKGWPRDMELSSIADNLNSFAIRGNCPHCEYAAAFQTVTSVYQGRNGRHDQCLVAAARCASCNDFILAILRLESSASGSSKWVYDAHHPIGKPSDGGYEDVPEGPRLDFQEALRCRWVDAYNATIEMCRRCLESSCIEFGADSNLALNDMINWVHKQGKITVSLFDMAHKIKLGGNRAAHPSDRTLTEKDADAVVEFTRMYLYHVYVMPANMARFNFDKPNLKEGKTT